MSSWEILKIGFKSLIHNKKRTVLTIIGTVIGIAAIVLMTSIGQGFQASVNQLIGQFGANIITIMPGSGNMYTAFVAPTFFTDDDVKAIEQVSGVTYVAGIATAELPVKYNGETKTLTVYGYPSDAITKLYGNLTETYIESGRPPRKNDKFVVMLGNLVAHKLFNKDILPGRTIEINGQRFRVISVFRKFGDEADDTSVNITLSAFKAITGEKNPHYIMIMAKVANTDKIKDIADRIKRVLKAHRGKDDFQVLTPEDMAKTVNQILGIITVIVTGIAAIALIVGAVGIMNTMYMSVTERTREIDWCYEGGWCDEGTDYGDIPGRGWAAGVDWWAYRGRNRRCAGPTCTVGGQNIRGHTLLHCIHISAANTRRCSVFNSARDYCRPPTGKACSGFGSSGGAEVRVIHLNVCLNIIYHGGQNNNHKRRCLPTAEVRKKA